MSGKIDIGNVRGIKGDKGEKGEQGKTPSYDDLRYQKQGDNFVTIKGTGNITQSDYYIDVDGNLCDSEGHIYDNQGNLTNGIGNPFDYSQYGYYYMRLWVDGEGRYCNSNGELLDENWEVQYVVSDFVSDIASFIYDDEEGYNQLVGDIAPNVALSILTANPSEYRSFFDEIEGDIKYYICVDNPRTNITLNNSTVTNTCKYYDENGNIAKNSSNQYLYVPLEKNALYLYNGNGYVSNDVMLYDIYLCTKAGTVPKKLVDSGDFVIDYNVIDGLSINTPNPSANEDERRIVLEILTRSTRGQFYSMDDVDTLLRNNLINKLGANNGIAQLNASGKVPSSQLPAYIDDVVEGTMNASETTFTPSDDDYIDSVQQTGKIYVDTSTRKTYRWTGSQYLFMSNPIVVDDGGSSAYSSSSGSALESEVEGLISRFGFDQTNQNKFNFAVVTKGTNKEYWILSNAYYDYEVSRFVKINNNYTSFGIQIQAEGVYPGEENVDNSNLGIGFWRNPKTSSYSKDLSTYDYADVDSHKYIGAKKKSNNEWVEFGISTGWTNNFMTDSYGGMTIGGNGIEIDGNGAFPYNRLTHSEYVSNGTTYVIEGILTNAYHPNGNTWECDDNNYDAWFYGLRTPIVSGVKDTDNTKFVIMCNDMSSVDSSSANYSVHDMVIDDWDIVYEVSDSGNVDDTVTDDSMMPVTSNAVYDALSDIVDELKSESMVISANKDIIQSGGTSVLTARVFGENKNNQSIEFYKKVSGSSDVLLDTITTDNGVAKYSYTGSGSGKKEIYAKKDDVVSVPHTVYDCIKYDKGNTANTIWTLGNNSNAQLDLVDNSYRKLSEITTGTDAWVYLKIDHQCVLEFDVKLVSTDYSKAFYQFGQTPNATTRSENNLLADLQNGDWHHIKIELNNGSVFVSSPETSTTKSYSLNNYDATLDMYFRFRTTYDITEISFKEFEYYPI